jgi:hypothetical protein
MNVGSNELNGKETVKAATEEVSPEIPNFKIQTSRKSQIPIFNGFGHGSLSGVWNLELGDYSHVVPPVPAYSHLFPPIPGYFSK